MFWLFIAEKKNLTLKEEFITKGPEPDNFDVKRHEPKN